MARPAPVYAELGAALRMLAAVALLSAPLPAAAVREVAGVATEAAPATAVIFVSAVCPISNDYVERLSALYKAYQARGIQFVFVNSNQDESEAEISKHARDNGLAYSIVKDKHNRIADHLGAQLTPEVFVLNRQGATVYHGAIDDSRNRVRVRTRGLADALDAVLAGKTVARPETRAFGCTIKREKSLQPIDEQGYAAMIRAHRGSALLVSVWATWCAPCREEMPALVELSRKHGGLRLVTISADEPEGEAAAAAFLTEHGAPRPFYIKRAKSDDEFIRAVDAAWSGALPALFLYGRTGRLSRSFFGDKAVSEAASVVERLGNSEP